MTKEHGDSQNYELSLDEKEEGAKPKVGGFYRGNTIFLPPRTPIQNMASFLHESGHILGKRLSFLDGDILLPDEVKKKKIGLNPAEKILLIGRLMDKKERPMEHFELKIAKKILEAITKGNPYVQKLKLINLTEDQLQKVITKWAGSHPSQIAYELDMNGDITPKDTELGVIAELPAFVIQKAGEVILCNSISSKNKYFGIQPGEFAGSHKAASKIVKGSYADRGYRIPSLYDFEKYGKEEIKKIYDEETKD
jgi:hypothetical protein